MTSIRKEIHNKGPSTKESKSIVHRLPAGKLALCRVSISLYLSIRTKSKALTFIIMNAARHLGLETLLRFDIII
jgi:hypothetical protein